MVKLCIIWARFEGHINIKAFQVLFVDLIAKVFKLTIVVMGLVLTGNLNLVTLWHFFLLEDRFSGSKSTLQPINLSDSGPERGNVSLYSNVLTHSWIWSVSSLWAVCTGYSFWDCQCSPWVWTRGRSTTHSSRPSCGATETGSFLKILCSFVAFFWGGEDNEI